MTEKTNQNPSKASTYEYLTINVNRDTEHLYTDCYRSFGWELLEGSHALLANPAQVSLKFKRDRRLNKRGEVNALQRKCETALNNIVNLERQKSSHAVGIAMLIGLVGTAFMALSVFSVTSGQIPLTILFGLLGFAGWGLGYFAYRYVKRMKSLQVAPLIDEQYEIVYNACEDALAV